MKPTSSIPAVREAARAATGHLQYYQTMMQQAKSSSQPLPRQPAPPANGNKK